jgi:segregation and condensation protein B
MNEQQLKSHIEALLFVEGPMQKKELAKLLSVSLEEIDMAVLALREGSAGRGITLADDGNSVELRTSASVSEKIEALRREEMSRDIGRAGLEVLAAVLYRGPLTRSEIDFIRGVNSSQTVRTLLMRGMLRKVSNPKDERSYLYEPTTELLASLSITSLQELPEYEVVRGKLNELEQTYLQSQNDSTT